jgi:uncharacterized membrane protein YphA (DoxX/SURF4 family)
MTRDHFMIGKKILGIVVVLLFWSFSILVILGFKPRCSSCILIMYLGTFF